MAINPVKTKTPGQLKREQDQENRRKQLLAQKEEKKREKFSSTFIETINGAYKNIVINSYIDVFLHNYGDEVIYKNFKDAFLFSSLKKQEDIIPSFTFNQEKVEFRSDMKSRLGRFNINTYDNFISNEQIINGDINTSANLETKEEEQGYNRQEFENIGKKSDSGNNPQFIPTSGERYGTFNRINKLRGFSTMESSSNEAKSIIEKQWKNEQTKIIRNSLQDNLKNI